jgi:hypothetical protein
MDITERYLQVEKDVLRIQAVLSERVKVYEKFLEECKEKGIDILTLTEEKENLIALIEQKKIELSAQLDEIEDELREFKRTI